MTTGEIVEQLITDVLSRQYVFRGQAGDVVTIRNRPNIRKLYNTVGESAPASSAEWLAVDKAAMKAIVTTLPTIDDVMLKVEVGKVVVFMSR